MAPIAFTLGILASLSQLALAGGCGSALPANLKPGTSTHNVTISSKSVIGQTTQRQYILHLPAGYSNSKPAPLIFAFHGQQQPAWSMEKISQLSDPAFNQDALVVYPQGMDVQSPGVQWLGDVEAPKSTVIDDRIFVEELRVQLTSTLCVDEKRIYGAGLSNGGGLIGLIMCDAQLNNRFAAFATVGGAFYPDSSLPEGLFQKHCVPNLQGRTLRYMNVHGLADKVVPYNGQATPPYIPVRTWVNRWVTSSCDKTPSSTLLEGNTVTDLKWNCGGQNDVIVHRTIQGYGHGWPSKTNQGEPFNTLSGGPTTWDLAPVMIKWFKTWSLA